jgi:tetratricopeptide (TPR) repeat protein
LKIAHEAKEGGGAGLEISILKKATQIFSTDPQAWTEYADALINESRREDSVLEKGDFFMAARNAWDHVLEMQPKHSGALLGKGRYLTMMAYRGGDDPSEGMHLLNRVIEQEAKGRLRAEAVFYLGIGYRRLGDEAKALEQFKKALKIDAFFMPARLAQN